MKKTFITIALAGILILADSNSAFAQRSFFGGRGNSGSGISIGFGLGGRGYGNNYYGNRGYSPYAQNYGYPYGNSQYGYGNSQYSPFGYGYNQSSPFTYGNTGPYYSPSRTYYSTPTYYDSTSTNPIVQASYVPQAAVQNLSSAITVKVPTAETQVWLGTTEMSLLGKERVFQMSDLEPGRLLTLTITARCTANGKAVEQSRQVELVGGKNNSVTFN